MTDLAQVLSYITPEMRHEFPEQLKVLEELQYVLNKYADPKSRTDNRSTRMVWDDNEAGFRLPDFQLPDMDALRRAMKSLRYDKLVLNESHVGNHEAIARKVDDTIRGSQVVTEQWAYYSQKGTEHSINSSSLLIPLNVPGPVVLDATANTNFMWNLFGPEGGDCANAVKGSRLLDCQIARRASCWTWQRRHDREGEDACSSGTSGFGARDRCRPFGVHVYAHGYETHRPGLLSRLCQL